MLLLFLLLLLLLGRVSPHLLSIFITKFIVLTMNKELLFMHESTSRGPNTVDIHTKEIFTLRQLYYNMYTHMLHQRLVSCLLWRQLPKKKRQ